MFGYVFAIASLAVLSAAYFIRHARYVSRLEKLVAPIRELHDAETAATESRIADALSLATGAKSVADDASRLLAAALAEANEQRERADRYFLAIQQMERERDEWKAISAGHILTYSQTQDMMLREISRLARLSGAEVSPVFCAVVESYKRRGALAPSSSTEAAGPAPAPAETLALDPSRDP